ncbi:MAG: hypothetical protein ABIP55_14970 [Tepidisphaeraceae bacterium]
MFLILLSAALVLATGGCERSPDTSADTSGADATEAMRPPVIETESDVIKTLRKRAEEGDISAMLTLGRAYQSRGGEKDRAEARKWFEKAVASGSALAKEALVNLDVAEAVVSGLVPDAAIGSPATRAGATTNAATQVATSGPASTQPLDLTKVTWKEIVASYESGKFVTVDRPDYKNMFVGLSTAEDQSMTVAATGPTGTELRNVKLLIRVRSRQQPSDSQRVAQGAAICATVTRNNVSRAELTEWVKNYLASEQKSEPIYRNGWQITVSGPAGEGQDDRKQYLGNAVVIELKR